MDSGNPDSANGHALAGFATVNVLGQYSLCQLMTASMPTFIGCNITAIRPTHDCFYANSGQIMTSD